jgi:uncharacterized protein YbbK (DUF523 family)
METKIKLGISTCLLGEKVRYDGTHKLDRFLRDTLGKYKVGRPVAGRSANIEIKNEWPY